MKMRSSIFQSTFLPPIHCTDFTSPYGLSSAWLLEAFSQFSTFVNQNPLFPIKSGSFTLVEENYREKTNCNHFLLSTVMQPYGVIHISIPYVLSVWPFKTWISTAISILMTCHLKLSLKRQDISLWQCHLFPLRLPRLNNNISLWYPETSVIVFGIIEVI